MGEGLAGAFGNKLDSPDDGRVEADVGCFAVADLRRYSAERDDAGVFGPTFRGSLHFTQLGVCAACLQVADQILNGRLTAVQKFVGQAQRLHQRSDFARENIRPNMSVANVQPIQGYGNPFFTHGL